MSIATGRTAVPKTGILTPPGSGITDIGFIPRLIDADNNPAPLEPAGDTGHCAVAYLKQITKRAVLHRSCAGCGPGRYTDGYPLFA